MRLKKSARKPKKPPTDEVVELEAARAVLVTDELADVEETLDRNLAGEVDGVVDGKLCLAVEDEKLNCKRGKDVVVGSAETFISFVVEIKVAAFVVAFKGCWAISGDVILTNTEVILALTADKVFGISLLVKSSCIMITCC